MELQFSTDIRKIKTKDVGNFSFKEAGFLALAGISAYVMYTVEKRVMGLEELNIPLLLPLPVLILVFGFAKPFGMSFFQFMRTAFIEYVIDPKIYIWESDFVYDLDGDNLAKDEKGHKRYLTDDEKQLYLMSDEVVTEPLPKSKEGKQMLKEIQSHII